MKSRAYDCQFASHKFCSANLPDDTICTLSNNVLDIILIRHVEGNLARSTRLPRHGEGEVD